MSKRKVRLTLESCDAGRRPELVILLSRLSGKAAGEIEPHLDHLPWRLASAMPEDQARELAARLEEAGARVRLEPVAETETPQTAGSTGGEPPPGKVGHVSDNGLPPPEPLGMKARLGWALRIAFGTKLTQLGLVLMSMLGSVIGMVLSMLLVGDTLTGQMRQMAQGGAVNPLGLMIALASPRFLGAMLIQFLVMLLVGMLYQGALLRLAPAYFRHGGRPPFGSLLRHAAARLPDLLSTSAVAYLPVMLLPMLALFVSDPTRPPHSALAAGAGVLLSIALGIALFLVMPVSANEPVGPWQAIRRGWRLASGYRLAFLGHLILLVLLLVLFLVGGMVALGLISFLSAQAHPLLAAVVAPVGYGLLILFLFFLLASFPILTVIFYLEARVRHEGACFDWFLLPAEDWPRCERPEPPAGRGLRAWGEFLLINGLLAGALLLAGPWLEARMSEMMRGLTMAMLLSSRNGIPVRAMPPARSGAPAAEQAGEEAASSGVPVLSNPTGIRFGTGALEVKRDMFFADARDPRLWIRVQASGLFGTVQKIPEKAVVVRIREVRARNGRNVLNAASPFESNPFFSQLRWTRTNGAYSAIRTVHLLPGVREEDITEIRGELDLRGSDVGHMTIPFALRDGKPFQMALQAGRPRPQGRREDASASSSGSDAARPAALPEDPEQAAYALYQQGRYRESIRLLDGILKAQPKNAWAWYTRAWAYWKLGDRDKAHADVAMACDLGYKDACSLKEH